MQSESQYDRQVSLTASPTDNSSLLTIMGPILRDRVSTHSEILPTTTTNRLLSLLTSRSTPNNPHIHLWENRMDFVLAAFTYAFGIGCVWRAPSIAVRDGEGMFLILFGIFMVIIGNPIFFFEVALGQFTHKSPIKVFQLCSLFEGVGYSMTMYSIILIFYIMTVTVHCTYYFIISFSTELPWLKCEPWLYGEPECTTSTNISKGLIYPTEQFYNRNLFPGPEHFFAHGLGQLRWPLVGCSVICWTFLCVLVSKGMRKIIKMMYVLGPMVIIFLLLLLVFLVIQDGAGSGLVFFFTPTWPDIQHINNWNYALEQSLYLLGLGMGPLILLGSYCHFQSPAHHDTLFVTSSVMLIALLSGAITFASIGISSYGSNISVRHSRNEGPGVLFRVFTEAFRCIPGTRLWSLFFFMLVAAISMCCMVILCETMLAAFSEMSTTISALRSQFFILIMIIFFLLHLPFITNNGFILVVMLVKYPVSLTIMFLVTSETIAAVYCYTLVQLCEDVEFMLGSYPHLYYRLCWVLCPIITMIFAVYHVTFRAIEETGNAITILGWFSSAVVLFPITFMACFNTIKSCRKGVLASVLRPQREFLGMEQEIFVGEHIVPMVSTSSSHQRCLSLRTCWLKLFGKNIHPTERIVSSGFET